MSKRSKGGVKNFLRQLVYYHTNKVVQIRSFKLGLLYYFLIALVLCYVCLWMIWWRKGYQSSDQLIGLTSVKVKGVSYLNTTNNGILVWDAEDVVRPAKESEALFITTNYMETPKQQRSHQCGTDVPCTSNTDCPVGAAYEDRGILSGVCDLSKGNGTCFMHAWCPTESRDDVNINNMLTGIDTSFTVFIRQTVKSTKWSFTTSNYVNTTVTEGPGKNLFSVDDMTGNTFSKVQKQGAVFAVIMNWEIDLDKKGIQWLPTFEFVKIADGADDKGYNYRYANYYYLQPNGTGNPIETRDLYKVFGLRFIFLLGGTARKFDIIPLIITIGSGLAFLSVAAVLADLIALYILPGRKFYNTVKYETIEHEFDDEKKELPNVTEATPLISSSSSTNIGEESVSLTTLEEGYHVNSLKGNGQILDTVRFK